MCAYTCLDVYINWIYLDSFTFNTGPVRDFGFILYVLKAYVDKYVYTYQPFTCWIPLAFQLPIVFTNDEHINLWRT